MAYPQKIVAILALPGVQLLDVSGPLDVLAQANAETGTEYYRLCVITDGPAEIKSSSGVCVLADYTLADGAAIPRIDTLLVAGGPRVMDRGYSDRLKSWLQKTAATANRFGSVCTGAFVLAATGLLGGKKVTTHWNCARRLANDFPDVIVQEDAIHIRDGRIRTAAGVTAGLDLALSFVEEDLGRAVGIKVASQLVMYFKRPGGQLQFSRNNKLPAQGRSVLQSVQRWIAANPSADLSVPRLAERAGLSARHFARIFFTELGVTPAAWVEEARIACARRLLEKGNQPPKQVAALCGFSNADVLRRAFARHVGVTPAEYRRNFTRADRPRP